MTAPDTESGEPDLVKLLPDLMARYQAAALNLILARFYFSLPGEAPLVEDLLQDHWLRIHRARHSYRPGQPVRQWVFAIAPRDLLDARQSLPGGQREVLMMLEVADMTVEGVARATGSTAAAVKQKACRAYQSVLQILGFHT